MEKKTLENRYANEVLSDNTVIPKFEQCKNCIFRKITINGKTVDDYRRGSCMMYPSPKMKPLQLKDGSEQCDYYEQEKRKK